MSLTLLSERCATKNECQQNLVLLSPLKEHAKITIKKNISLIIALQNVFSCNSHLLEILFYALTLARYEK